MRFDQRLLECPQFLAAPLICSPPARRVAASGDGARTGDPIPPKPMTRMANAGHDTRGIQDWLGHRSIQHTVRYRVGATRFKDFWR